MDIWSALLQMVEITWAEKKRSSQKLVESESILAVFWKVWEVTRRYRNQDESNLQSDQCFENSAVSRGSTKHKLSADQNIFLSFVKLAKKHNGEKSRKMYQYSEADCQNDVVELVVRQWGSRRRRTETYHFQNRDIDLSYCGAKDGGAIGMAVSNNEVSEGRNDDMDISDGEASDESEEVMVTQKVKRFKKLHRLDVTMAQQKILHKLWTKKKTLWDN